ncbi:hypothetical protein ACOSP7_015305 [Xanthoceras sorbifolium]
MVFNEKCGDNVIFWSLAKEFLDEFKAANMQSPSSLSQVPLLQKWRPPDRLSFKLKTNAAVDGKGGKSGLWAVIRDCYGKLCAAAFVTTCGSLDIEVNEANAILVGLQLAVEGGFWPLFVKTDSLNVANMCSGSSSSRGDIFNIV